MPREVLVIRGRLDRAGRFIPGRSRSTPNVREWPVVRESDIIIFVELLDEADRVLHRELTQVRPDIGCQPGRGDQYRCRIGTGREGGRPGTLHVQGYRPEPRLRLH